MYRALCALVLSMLATAGHARPVTYPGGSMSMTEVDGSFVFTQVDHTLNRHVAVGAYLLTESDGDRKSAGVVANVLLMRRNTEDSQSNIYLMGGVGPSWVRNSRFSASTTEASGFAGAEVDWETRRFSVAASGKVSIVGTDMQGGWRSKRGDSRLLAAKPNLRR
jgi:hypothetical protein